MSAVIKVSFPGPDLQESASGAGRFERFPGGEHPLLAELCERTLEVFSDALRRMFEKADDLLFELGERSQSDAERHRNFDTMRIIRLERERVTACFIARFREGFAEESPSLPAIDTGALGAIPLDFSLQTPDELEEKIAIGNMASKVASLHQAALYAVECRLKSARVEHAVPVSLSCLDPGRVCAALGSGIGAIDTDLRVKLVVYKLLDQVVAGDFGRAYRVALGVFQEHGIHPARKTVAASATSKEPDLRLRIRRDPGEPSIGAAAEQILRRHGLNPEVDALHAADGDHLRQRIIRISQNCGWDGLQAATQRLTMAGRLIDELLSERSIPEAVRPILEGARLGVYQTALDDADFFANANHPVRRDLCAILDAAIEDRGEGGSVGVTGGLGITGPLCALPSRKPDVDAEGPAPVPPEDVRRFLEQLRTQALQRRRKLLLQVRTQVRGELDARIGRRRIPEPAQALLRHGVGPLMALRLLRGGRKSVAFEQASTTVDGVLASLEFTPPASAEVLRDREDLLSSIVTSLSDIGMREDRIESLLNGMRELYVTLDRSPAPRAAPAARSAPLPAAERAAVTGAAGMLPAVTVMELLSRVLEAGTWYRVFDASHDQTRWLKLESFYPQQDSIIFSGFDEAHRLSLHASRFARDLALGHSEPINPGIFARDSLAQLQAAKARGVF